jgi:hypothetical protein
MERRKLVVGKYVIEHAAFRCCVCVDLNRYYVKYGCFNLNDTKQLSVANFFFRSIICGEFDTLALTTTPLLGNV